MIKVQTNSNVYDDVFRTLVVDCSHLLIPIINEAFGEHYTGKEEIVFRQNEHFLRQQGPHEQKRISDSSFQIIGLVSKSYLLECQSKPDSSLLVRIFEYITQTALDEGEVTSNRLLVEIPNAAILFLRSTSNTPDRMTIEMHTPGGTVSFDVQILKMVNYSLDTIFEKKLYFLIPFYIFLYRNSSPS